tara:strand:- start:256 stop:1353 length:1098 start_codon:yes stop_codon:yes gene_type:complete
MKRLIQISSIIFLAITIDLYKNTIKAEVESNNISDKINVQNSKELEPHINTNSVQIKWEKYFEEDKKNTNWEAINQDDIDLMKRYSFTSNKINNKKSLGSLNRSLVINDEVIGPDISWLVPPGFSWSKNFKFDASVRGHSRRKKGESFLAWNGGDAVGQFYFHPFHFKKNSFGFNLGMRSIYSGSLTGGSTTVGEGLSAGFRFDRKLSGTSGMAIGAEQLIHFDGLTDTGRDLYWTFSKGWWSKKYNNDQFPLTIATAGIGTGKLAEGNIKGLCSDLLGGSGTEVAHRRRLCWAPIFSLSRVYNEKVSTFFEYNSKFFLLGSSFVPSEKIPLRGTFAVQLSDHIDNYKLNNLEELKWVFRLSLGF